MASVAAIGGTAGEVAAGRLQAGAAKRLTVVVGSAGAGKSVLLSSWTAARDGAVTSWLSCDEADADPVRFWTAFIEAPRAVAPGFGADAAELLVMDGAMSADVTASIANDAAKLPAGSAIVVDDFHAAAAAAAGAMTDLVERWPAATVQLVLAGRADPPLRLHRLRMSGELCELRDRDLYLSLAESSALLANFGVQVAAGELALLHQRSEGWAAALQMAALTLRGTKDPVQVARALDIRSHEVAEYFIGEVLEQQPPEVVSFMLETSVLDELTAEACAAVTGRTDAAALLRGIDSGNLFIVALDDDRTSYRYHHLVRDVLRAELRAMDRPRELALQLRAAEWLESTGDTRRATRHFLAAQQAERALALLQDHVTADFLHDPAPPAALDLSKLDPALLTGAPDRLLAIAADLLLWGNWERGGEYLDLIERTQPAIPTDSRLASRLAAMRSLRCALTGEADEAVCHGLATRRIEERTLRGDEWSTAAPLVLLRAYTWLEDFEAVDREVAAALALPSLAESARLVDVRGAAAWPRPLKPPGRLMLTRGDWDSASTPSPWTTCAFWRAPRSSSGTSTRRNTSPNVRYRYQSGSGPFLSFSLCSTGPRSGRPAGRSTMGWQASKQHASSWPEQNQCSWREPTSWRQSCAFRSATCARRTGWRPGWPPPGAVCCWPGSRSPRTITALPWSTWMRGRWGT